MINDSAINTNYINSNLIGSQGFLANSLTSGLAFGDVFTENYAKNILELLTLSTSSSHTGVFNKSFVDGFIGSDSFLISYIKTISETLIMSDVSIETWQMLQTVLEEIQFSETFSTTLSAVSTITILLVLSELLTSGLGIEVTEEIILSETFLNNIKALNTMVEQGVFSDSGAYTFQAIQIVNESLILSETLTPNQILYQSLVDGLIFGGQLNLNNETYDAWVLNPENLSSRKYENYIFNSYCESNNTVFGVSEDGIYELVGDTDNGTDIDSVIRSGLINLGTKQKKSFPRAYLGFAANDALVLKVITTDGGDKRTTYYKLFAKNANAIRESRIRLGKGTRAVYWQFELVNTNGSDFELDHLKLLPLELERSV